MIITQNSIHSNGKFSPNSPSPSTSLHHISDETNIISEIKFMKFTDLEDNTVTPATMISQLR